MASFRRMVCAFVYTGYIIIKGEYLLKLQFFAKFWKIFITTLLASSSEDKVKMR